MRCEFIQPDSLVESLIQKHWEAVSDDASKDLDPASVVNEMVRRGAVFVGVTNGKDFGCFVLEPLACYIYEVHTILNMTGADAVEAGRAAIEKMFLETDCRKIVSRCPDENRASMMYAYACGFTRLHHQAGTHKKGGEEQGSTLVQLSIEVWLFSKARGRNWLELASAIEKITNRTKREQVQAEIRATFHPIHTKLCQ